MESIIQDLKHAGRALRNTPTFTAAAVATLALGIGANTAIFQLLDAVRLRSLPVVEPHSLARIHIRHGNTSFGLIDNSDMLTYPLFERLQDKQQAFSALFAWQLDRERLGQGAQGRRADVLSVSGGFFSTLQIQPSLGRLFRGEDDFLSCPNPGVVLSYNFWQREFAGQPSAIGARLIVQDRRLEIIGVTPPRFSGPEVGRKFDIALPLCAHSVLHHGDAAPFRQRDNFWIFVMGRLKPGWTLAQATEQLQAISPALMQTTEPGGYSRSALDTYLQFRLEALPGTNGVSEARENYDTPLSVLFGVTGFVLLIACANLANLTLARASARERDFAIRAALGASRSRLMRLVLSESLLLALCGTSLGLYIAQTLSSAIVRFLATEENPLYLEISLDWRMIGFTSLATVGVCLALGLVPALRSARSMPWVIHIDRRRFRFQRLLVVVQIAASLGLVAAALLFVRNFRALVTLDPGFREQGILMASFDMSRLAVSSQTVRSYQRQLLDEVRSSPLVETAVSTSNFLVGGGMWSLGIDVNGKAGWSRFTWVSPGYFAALDTPLLAGRDFNDSDTAASSKVVIVNQTFARQYLAGANPLGLTFRTAPEPGYPAAEYQIVGLTKDTKYFDLRESVPPIAYAPALQNPDASPYSNLYIRSSAPLSSLGVEVRKRVSAWQPEVGMEFHVFEQRIADGLVRERLMAWLSGFFGVLAALLAAIGLYGVLAYIAARRRKEMSIRMAVGASHVQIMKLILGDAALLVAIGVSIGLLGSLAVARVTESLLFGISARDPFTFAAAAIVLTAAAAVGSLLPALRASRLDPMIALRDQ